MDWEGEKSSLQVKHGTVECSYRCEWMEREPEFMDVQCPRTERVQRRRWRRKKRKLGFELSPIAWKGRQERPECHLESFQVIQCEKTCREWGRVDEG